MSNSYRCKIYTGVPNKDDSYSSPTEKRKSNWIYIDAPNPAMARALVRNKYVPSFLNENEVVINISASRVPTARALEAMGSTSLFNLSKIAGIQTKMSAFNE